MNRSSVNNIAEVIGNNPLAKSLVQSIQFARRHPHVRLTSDRSTLLVFRQSLDAAVRDIREHPRGKLFQRLIEYGPCKEDEVNIAVCTGEDTLSPSECASCVEFIFSHMVNRFKGELAELLALEPCIRLMEQLKSKGRIKSDVDLYWGEMVQERRRVKKTAEMIWAGFAKGADGLMVSDERTGPRNGLDVTGIIEIKSMVLSWRRVTGQISRHISRLEGGLKLGKKTTEGKRVRVAYPIRVAVMPSTWKIARDWRTGRSRKLIFPELYEPPVETQVEQLDEDYWKITLAWSEEALEQAAYEMTFNYMSQVGECVYSEKPLPKTWEYMTPSEAGYNAIKEALYYILLLNLPKRQDRLAIKLYNIYSFGYALGAKSCGMLWPKDFPDED